MDCNVQSAWNIVNIVIIMKLAFFVRMHINLMNQYHYVNAIMEPIMTQYLINVKTVWNIVYSARRKQFVKPAINSIILINKIKYV